MITPRTWGLLALLYYLAPISLMGQLVTITSPVSRIVYQRNLADEAEIYISGNVSEPTALIEARLQTRTGETGVAVPWKSIVFHVNGNFSGAIKATKGRYDLEIRATQNASSSITVVDRVGVGEVFLIVGHSNAAGIPEYSYASSNDMVTSINPKMNHPQEKLYDKTASPEHLPFNFSQLCQDCGIAPFGYTSGMWSRLGELLIEELGIPVLFYSAAFGGSNLSQTRMSAYGVPFEHSFVNSSIGMPYANIGNTLSTYVPKTGIRAVLAAHGVNDMGSTTTQFYNDYVDVINKSREALPYRNLVWMVATSCYNNGVGEHIVTAQKNVVRNQPNVFTGANLNEIGLTDRRDGLHFNAGGVLKAGQYWRDAIMAANFLTNAVPISPQTPVITPLPVTLISFTGKKVEGKTNLEWLTATESNNSHFEIEYSADAKSFEQIGVKDGAGNSGVPQRYRFVVDQVRPENAYYRLKQVDLDQKFSYSRIILVAGDEPENFISPNPSQQEITIHSEGMDLIISVSILNASSQQVLVKRSAGKVDISALNPGAYMVVAKTKNGKVISKKLIKN